MATNSYEFEGSLYFEPSLRINIVNQPTSQKGMQSSNSDYAPRLLTYVKVCSWAAESLAHVLGETL